MLDLELLASIASGGLGQWVEGKNGPAYAKSEDCIGAPACAAAACQVEETGGQACQGGRSGAAPCTPALLPLLPLVAGLVLSSALASNSSHLNPAGCLKDLQRFFRADDPEERPAFFAVHKYNLVSRPAGAAWGPFRLLHLPPGQAGRAHEECLPVL